MRATLAFDGLKFVHKGLPSEDKTYLPTKIFINKRLMTQSERAALTICDHLFTWKKKYIITVLKQVTVTGFEPTIT